MYVGGKKLLCLKGEKWSSMVGWEWYFLSSPIAPPLSTPECGAHTGALCRFYPDHGHCEGLTLTGVPFSQDHVFPSMSCPLFYLNYDKHWWKERSSLELFNFFPVAYPPYLCSLPHTLVSFLDPQEMIYREARQSQRAERWVVRQENSGLKEVSRGSVTRVLTC